MLPKRKEEKHMEKMTHKQRIMNAIACERVDRTAYNNFDGGLLGRWADPEFCPGDMYLRPEWAMDKVIEGSLKMGGDTMPNLQYSPLMCIDLTGIYYLTPGKEIGSDMCPQAVEPDNMKPEHYDYILENGPEAWFKEFVEPGWEKFMPDFEKGLAVMEEFTKRCEKTGENWVSFNGVYNYGGPLYLSCTRGFTNFFKDIRKMPEKVKKAAELINKWEIEKMTEQAGGKNSVEIYQSALARFDGDQLSQEKFDEFIWPSYKYYNDMLEGTDIINEYHVDGNFTDNLGRHIKELRPKKTIIQFDGFTNHEVFADELVKHQICVYGDIPAAMLTNGEPEEVYNRVIWLKKLYGPGLWLGSGCGTPYNTKFENIQAFIEAAETNNY